MPKLKRLCIPDWEKEKGLIWVAYPVCVFYWWQPCAIVELKIKQEWN